MMSEAHVAPATELSIWLDDLTQSFPRREIVPIIIPILQKRKLRPERECQAQDDSQRVPEAGVCSPTHHHRRVNDNQPLPTGAAPLMGSWEP